MELKKSRRRFLGFAAKGATLASAVFGGLIPELSARAAAATTTADATTVSTDVPPLDPTSQATLYSQALNDPGVAMLVRTLSEPGRLDPPTQSFDMTLDVNRSTQQIIMPVASYSSGAVIAYLLYGSGSGMTNNGSPMPVAVKTLISNTGQTTFVVNGILQDATSIDPMPAMFAFFFPSEYAVARSSVLMQTMQVVKGRKGFDGRFLRKVGLAYDGTSSGALGSSDPCVRKAGRDLDACVQTTNKAFYAAIGGFVAAAVCIAWALALIASAVGTVAISAWAYWCGAAVGAFAILVINYKQDLAACETLFNGDIALCKRQHDRLVPA